MAKEIILPFSELKGTLDAISNEPTLEITENGVYNVKGYSYADVNVEGGGGSSDFSTAKVTLINNGSPNGYKISLPNLTDENGIDFASDIIVPSEVLVQVPLYKGKLKVSFAIDDVTEDKPTVSGDIFLDDDFEYLLITGDGTFTATASPGV